jgi:translocation and assembly module TamB
LRVRVGRIDGSIYGRAVLEDTTLLDPHGAFLKVPVTTLDWRPFAWFTSGLDIHELTLRRGQLLRLPQLRPGDPNAPLLPDFNIRIDRLAIERLTVAKAVLDANPKPTEAKSSLNEERRIDFRARITAQGRLGGGDRLVALLDADRAQNRFVLALDYAAPKAGLLAALTGAHVDREAKVSGHGTWTEWHGQAHVTQARQPLATLALTNRDGHFAAEGQIWTFALPDPPRRVLGTMVAVKAEATLADEVLTGHLTARSQQFDLATQGGVDLAHNTLHGLALDLRLAPTDLFGAASRTTGTHLHAHLHGPFAALIVPFTLTADRFADPRNQLERIAATGTAQRDGPRWRIPLNLTIGHIITGHPDVDPRLVDIGQPPRPLRPAGAARRTGVTGLYHHRPGPGARLAHRQSRPGRRQRGDGPQTGPRGRVGPRAQTERPARPGR